MTMMNSFPIPWRRLAALVCGLCSLSTATHAQEIARLYAPQAPAGSSYVRVLNPEAQNRRVTIGRNPADILHGNQKPASDYRVVDAAGDLIITLDGRTLPPLKIAAGGFYTVVLPPTPIQTPALIADATDGRNDLKAELRFYNLIANCDAALRLQDGAQIFSGVNTNQAARRSINPVRASVSGQCSNGASNNAAAASTLPPMKSGDRVSVFLTGTVAQPRLSSQVDATAAYSGSR